MPLVRTPAQTWFGVLLVATALGCGKSSGGASGTGGTGVGGSGSGGRMVGESGGVAGKGGGASGGVAGSASGGVAGSASGGVAGSAGGGTVGAGSAGVSGTGGANECGPRDEGARLWVSTPRSAATAGDTHYDGPAIVERSTATSLELILDPSSDGAGGAGGADPSGQAGAGDGEASDGLVHTKLSGLDPMPRLAPGTKLWVTKDPLEDPPFSFGPRPGWALSVRDREDGTLLFGSAYNDFESAASPAKVGALMTVCTAPSPQTQCAPGASMDYHSVEVLGDSSVTVEDGVPGAITLGGVPYEVRVTARSEFSVQPSPCADYFGVSGVALDVVATRLDELLPTLEVGPAPSCVSGADPDPSVYFGIYEVDLNTSYAGVVTYIGPDVNDPTAYTFAVPGLPSLTDRQAVLYISGSSLLMPEPALGQEFWLSYPSYRVSALRESEDGPVIIAQSYGMVGAEAAQGVAALGDMLGVAVTLDDVCEYDPGVPLQDTVFATTPELRVASGTSSPLDLGGRSYRVWAWGQGYSQVAVYPADRAESFRARQSEESSSASDARPRLVPGSSRRRTRDGGSTGSDSRRSTSG